VSVLRLPRHRDDTGRRPRFDVTSSAYRRSNWSGPSLARLLPGSGQRNIQPEWEVHPDVNSVVEWPLSEPSEDVEFMLNGDADVALTHAPDGSWLAWRPEPAPYTPRWTLPGPSWTTREEWDDVRLGWAENRVVDALGGSARHIWTIAQWDRTHVQTGEDPGAPLGVGSERSPLENPPSGPGRPRDRARFQPSPPHRDTARPYERKQDRPVDRADNTRDVRAEGSMATCTVAGPDRR
jgi:hypothetical protein